MRRAGVEAQLRRTLAPHLITGLCADPGVNQLGRDYAENLMRAVGSTFWVEQETQLDAVTALSGSGPAYVFLLLELLEHLGCAGLADADRLGGRTQGTGAGHHVQQTEVAQAQPM